MTVKELIENYHFFLKKDISHYDMNYIITNNDIDNEIFCQKYNFNAINMLSNYGLFNYNDNISFFFNRLIEIEIIPDKYNIECNGGIINLQCVAKIAIMKDNEEFKIVYQKINPIYTIKNLNFNNSKNYLEFTKNTDFYDKIYTISAKYGYNGKIYTTDLKLVQKANYISDWIFEKNDNETVYAKLSTDRIPNSGATISVQVFKEYTKKFYKKDCFNNIIKTNISDSYIEDITDETIIKSPNLLLIKKNTIIIPPQDFNSEERNIEISCLYQSKEIKLTIKQEKGCSITYNNILSYSDNINYKKIELKSCNNDKIILPIISKQIRYLDGKKYDEIDDFNIKIINNYDWVNININNLNSSIDILISDNNTDVNRIAKITFLKNNLPIYLDIIQFSKEKINTNYQIDININEPLSLENISKNFILIKPYKEDIYDNGSIEKIQTLEPFFSIDSILFSSNENVVKLSSPKLIDFNGTYIVYFIYNNENFNEDIEMTLKCRILNNKQKQVSDVYNKTFFLKAKEKPKKKIKDVEITVNVLNENNYNCAFSHNNNIIKVIDSSNNTLLYDNISRFWVSNEMKNDLVYCNKISLNENEKYTFQIDSYFYLDKKTNILNEQYLIEDDDIGIDLYIKI